MEAAELEGGGRWGGDPPRLPKQRAKEHEGAEAV